MSAYYQVEQDVLARMSSTGDYIIGVEGRYYWANDEKSGVLIEAASSQEIYVVQQMALDGATAIVHEYKRNTLK